MICVMFAFCRFLGDLKIRRGSIDLGQGGWMVMASSARSAQWPTGVSFHHAVPRFLSATNIWAITTTICIGVISLLWGWQILRGVYNRLVQLKVFTCFRSGHQGGGHGTLGSSTAAAVCGPSIRGKCCTTSRCAAALRRASGRDWAYYQPADEICGRSKG